MESYLYSLKGPHFCWNLIYTLSCQSSDMPHTPVTQRSIKMKILQYTFSKSGILKIYFFQYCQLGQVYFPVHKTSLICPRDYTAKYRPLALGVYVEILPFPRRGIQRINPFNISPYLVGQYRRYPFLKNAKNYTLSVLGLDSGCMIKYNPSPSGNPSHKGLYLY